MPKVFICYRREDAEDITGRIYDRLAAHYGVRNVVFDVDTVPIGVNFRTYLDDQVRSCDVLLAIIGRDWLTAVDEDGVRRLDRERDFLRIEIESAKENRIPVIPVLVRRAKPPADRELPPSLSFLAAINAAVVSSGRDFEAHMHRLVNGIDLLVEVRATQAPAEATSRASRGSAGSQGDIDPGERLLQELKRRASELLPSASWMERRGWWYLGSQRGLHVLKARATRNTLRVRVRKNSSKRTGTSATVNGWIYSGHRQPVLLRSDGELAQALHLFKSEWL